MVSVQVDGVPEPRVCDLLGWVEGEVLGNIEGGDTVPAGQVRANYRLAGQIAAKIHNQAEHWRLPDGFQRQVMDGEGLVGKRGYLGDFRTHADLAPEQLAQLEKAADAVSRDLEAFGKTPDRFGLTHADFLPENLLIDNSNMRIIDFDDCGFGWYMMDIATALFFLQGEETFDVAREGLIEGYRSERTLTDEHLAMLPACFMARALAYVSWVATRHETETAREISAALIEDATALAEAYLE
jgi:Ser/Thr protein kinase RdoA (MazF antagonist)